MFCVQNRRSSRRGCRGFTRSISSLHSLWINSSTITFPFHIANNKENREVTISFSTVNLISASHSALCSANGDHWRSFSWYFHLISSQNPEIRRVYLSPRLLNFYLEELKTIIISNIPAEKVVRRSWILTLFWALVISWYGTNQQTVGQSFALW